MARRIYIPPRTTKWQGDFRGYRPYDPLQPRVPRGHPEGGQWLPYPPYWSARKPSWDQVTRRPRRGLLSPVEDVVSGALDNLEDKVRGALSAATIATLGPRFLGSFIARLRAQAFLVFTDPQLARGTVIRRAVVQRPRAAGPRPGRVRGPSARRL